MELAVAIQQCYRHLFFPTRNLRIPDAGIDLGHVAFDVAAASEKPGSGQARVLAALGDHQKLVRATDPPLAGAYIRDKTPLKHRPLSTEELRNEFRKDPALPILLSDSSFIEFLRKGISDGLFVYQHGELVWGPGDAAADIKIDARALVMTVADAKKQGVWPRAPEPGPDPDPKPDPDGGGDSQGHAGTAGVGTGGDKSIGKLAATKPPPQAIVVEAPLKEALTRIWDIARQRKVTRLASLHLRMFEPEDAFRLVPALGIVQGAAKRIAISAAYETSDGSAFEVEFKGSPNEAKLLQEFLEPQLRTVSESTCTTLIALTFASGLALEGDATEKLTAQLTRFASGAAQVHATAEPLPEGHGGAA